MIAQYRGAKNHSSMNKVAAQTVLMTMCVSAIISVLGYFASGLIIEFMGVEPLVTQYATEYLKVSFAGMIFVFGFMSFQGLLRGVGEVKVPAFIILGTVLLNLIVDPIFIMGYGIIPSMGVAGAAYATIITQSIAFSIVLALLVKGQYGIKLKLKNLKPNFKLMKRIFAIGLPSSIEMSAKSLGMLAMTYLIASFGTVAVAAYGIVGQMFSLIILPAMGISMAASTIVGQNIGAGKVPRAESTANKSTLIGFVLLTAVGAVLFVFGGAVARIFVPDDPAVIAQAASFMKIIALAFGFLGSQQILSGVFQGAGETKVAMTISLIALWLVQIPFAYFASRYTALGADGVLLAFPISYVLGMGIALFWFLRGNWKHRRITHEVEL